MIHRSLALFASLLLVPGCLFDPDDHPLLDDATGEAGDEAADEEGDEEEDPDEDEPNACLEVEQTCERGLDCCNYDPEFPPGSTQCVQVDEAAACTTICFEANDCASGCCAVLAGIDAYGACVDASVCASG